MAVFVATRLGLTALGYAALRDASSIDFQVWMGAFMVAPMIIWMRKLVGAVRTLGLEVGAATVRLNVTGLLRAA